MMEKDTLRKADIFSGGVIFLVGAFIVSQALKMPMKDSWGGVQNVWYVSPAIFPLFVGAMIMLLGGLLIRTALKEVGWKALTSVKSYLFSRDFPRFLALEANIRFYAIVSLLFSFVFLFIPRVDFFLAAIEFLLVFICMFHLEDNALLKKLFLFYMGQVLLFILFIATGLNERASTLTEHPGDVLFFIFIPAFAVYAKRLCKGDDRLGKKFRTALVVAFVSPLLIGIIFKYLLLVPMPFEGLVVEWMDAVWYLDFD